MKSYPTDHVRNILIAGHGGAGKTSLVEAVPPPGPPTGFSGRGRHHGDRLRARGDAQADLGLPGCRPGRARRLQDQPARRLRPCRLRGRRARPCPPPTRSCSWSRRSRGSRPRPRPDDGRGVGLPPGLLHQQAGPTGRRSPAASTVSRPPSARRARPVPAHRRGGARLRRPCRPAVGPGLHLRERPARRGRRPRRADRRYGYLREQLEAVIQESEDEELAGPLPRRGVEIALTDLIGDLEQAGGRRAAVPGAGRGGHPQHRRGRVAGGLHPGLPRRSSGPRSRAAALTLTAPWPRTCSRPSPTSASGA